MSPHLEPSDPASALPLPVDCRVASPAPLPRNPLEPLIAALLAQDPGAGLDRTPRSYRLTLSDASILHCFPVGSVAQLDADVAEAVAAVKPGQRVRYLARADLQGAKEVLLRRVPSRWVQVRSTHAAHLWSPEQGVVDVRGTGLALLKAAHRKLGETAHLSLDAVADERADQSAEAARFMQPLLARPPVMTIALAGLSVAMFALQMLWGGGAPYVSGTRMGASMQSLIAQGELWRLLAPMLLHGSVTHLLFNMLALFSFGAFLERFLGWRRYLLLYLLSGLGGGIASALRSEELISVGASGGIWGLMLGGAVLLARSQGRLPRLVVAAQQGRVWVPVGINAVYSLQPGVDLLAHFGGGLVGAALMGSGLLLAGIPLVKDSNDPAHPPRREGVVVNVAAFALGFALLLSMGVSWWSGRPWELQQIPPVSTVEVASENASLELPHLLGRAHAESHTWVFGSLSVDPMVVIVAFAPEPLEEGQAADPRGTLEKSLESLAPGGLAGFTLVTSNRVQETADGRPYLFAEQQASDGRVARNYWFTQGTRLANVLVITRDSSLAGWQAASKSVPFSLLLR